MHNSLYKNTYFIFLFLWAYKNYSTILVLFLIFFQISFSQKIKTQNYYLTKLRIDASFKLKKDRESFTKYFEKNPEILKKSNTSKKKSWGFKVGDTKSWYCNDFTTEEQYLVNSTCQKVGDNCYIFVENSQWNKQVNANIVNSIQLAFDKQTPNNSNKGIYQTVTEYFGEPPDIDSDPKIIILLCDIKDGYDGSGGWIWGYFSARNETSLSGYNNAEIFYIDCNPTTLTDPSHLQNTLGTLAHEFQHMVHWRYQKTNQYTFIEEGCSLISEHICGYPLYDQSGFINETNHYLLDWRDFDYEAVLRDYSRASRFMLYLHDQFGPQIFKYIVQSSSRGIGGVNDALKKIGSSLQFTDVFKNWAIANIFDDRSIDTAYGYKYPDLPKVSTKLNINPNISLYTGEVQKYAADYQSYKFCNNLKINITNYSNSMISKAFAIGNNKKKIIDLNSNIEYFEPELGTTYNEVNFVFINTNQYLTGAYTFKSTGNLPTIPVELKYDDTEPDGVLIGSDNDTICVIFNGITGARLDSIRVALRGTQSMVGGIWKWTGHIQPTPLGEKLTPPFRVYPPLNYRPTTPYPIPWPNWGKVDLSSLKIDAGSDFAVAFIDSGEYVSAPFPQRVMAANKKGLSFANSCAYSNRGEGKSWDYSADGNGNADIYLIRAYLSFPETNQIKIIEPSIPVYSLSQNYPNPFNPSTTINFSLSERQSISLKIYNTLGEEVVTLATGLYDAGNHKITWTAAGFSSGIYYYKLTGKNYSEVKKLVLLK